MLNTPPVHFPDVAGWAVTYLTAALGEGDEPYADADVSTDLPNPVPPYAVTVRDDGGPRGSHVTKTVSLGVNVYAPTIADASDLSRLVAALFEQAPGSGTVVAFLGSSGPYPVPEKSSKPHWYLSVDLAVRGGTLVRSES